MNKSTITVVLKRTFALAVLAIPALSTAHDDSDMRVKKTVYDSKSKKGDPVTITWGIIPDGTVMPDYATTPGTKLKSNFVSSIDKAYKYKGDTKGTDYSNRPWFKVMQKSLSEFESKTGISYEYVPYDDGSKFDHQSSLGAKNSKADLRIGGLKLDNSQGIRAYSGFPNTTGHMPNIAFNTSHPLFSNKKNLHYLMAHEHMHSLGIGHMLVNNHPKFSAVDRFGLGLGQGPQFDDLLALHMRYGDKYEKNGGNDTFQKATVLGELKAGGKLGLGLDAKGLLVKSDEVDFVSIDGSSDKDVYMFTVKDKTSATVKLTPRGPEYMYIAERISQKKQKINAAKLNDLKFTLSKRGNAKLTISEQPKGVEETITTNLTPGTYYITVTGQNDEPQLYSVEVLAE